MNKKKNKKVRCFRCNKLVEKDKLNDTDLCPKCAKEEAEMLKEDYDYLNPEDQHEDY